MTGRHPLKLRVGIDRNCNRLFGLDYSFTAKEYEKLVKNQLKDPYKDTWNKLVANVDKADKIIDGLMPYFSFDLFKEQFYNDKSLEVMHEKTSLIYVRDFVCKKYLKNNNLPMSVKITDSVASILKFTKTENLPMRSITPTLCQNYEDYMFKKSKTKTRNGAGINMRHIRILFNEAIGTRLIPKEWYPFKRESGLISEFENPYVIPNEQKVKTYLKEDEFIKFAEVDKFYSKAQEEGHAAFMISFHCNGANAADFLRFKFRDIQGGFIIFYREKIKNVTKTNRKPIKIYLSAELIALIKKYGNPPASNNYIFKCFTDEMSEDERYQARLKFNRSATNAMKLIVDDLGFNKNLSIGKARHTLTNIFKKNKVDREFVKDILGHTSILTADNYYDQFEEDQHSSIFNTIVASSKMKERLQRPVNL